MSKPLSEYKNNIGNGAWFLLHTMAEAAQTPALMAAYAHNFRNLCGKMSACGCEDHCIRMLTELPPEQFFHLLDEDGVPDGCLRHSVECHNRVNQRLGKTVYPYETVKPLYRSKEPPAPCTKGKTDHNRNSTPVESKDISTEGQGYTRKGSYSESISKISKRKEEPKSTSTRRTFMMVPV